MQAIAFEVNILSITKNGEKPMDLMTVKQRYWDGLQASRRLTPATLDRWLDTHVAADVRWEMPCPFDSISGVEALKSQVWQPLLNAMPDLERRVDILLAGDFKGKQWVASCGHYVGLFKADWLGIPATGRPLWLRFGNFEAIENGRTVEAYTILDIPGAMIQTGCWPLAPPLGKDITMPAPASQDGVRFTQDLAETDKSLKLVEAMIAGLMRYDRLSLASMGMVDFWTPDFHWYGPAPIGAMRGHKDYERGHQRPFLRAFPDRVGGDHKCRMGDNAYVASTGWPSIRATHLGSGWFGLPQSEKRISMRVMDFWHREGNMLNENWVFIDIPDLCRQLGLDIFQRMAELKASSDTVA